MTPTPVRHLSPHARRAGAIERELEAMSAVLETSDAPALVHDGLVVVQANPRLERLCGRELTGVDLTELLGATSRGVLLSSGEHELATASGVRPVRLAGGALGDGHGWAVVVDLSAEQAENERLLEARERLELALRSMAAGVVLTDADGRVEYLNPAGERLTGWSRDDSRARPAAELLRTHSEEGRAPVPDPVSRCLASWSTEESERGVLLVRRDGSEVAVHATASPLFNCTGELTGAVLVFDDVSGLRRLEREMAFLAKHDPLTGLINRREFEAALRLALDSAAGGEHEHVLLYIDLDAFKIVNDTCGHLVGDELLKQVAELLLSRLRRQDTLARLGGDEFGVVLHDCPPAVAGEIAEAIRRTLREFRFVSGDKIFEIGASIGMVPIGRDSGGLDDVLRRADAACYVAKEAGGNRSHAFTLDDSAIGTRFGEMQWVQRLQRALDERRLQLHYQLIKPLARDGAPRQLCEIFLRMVEIDGQLIAPQAFIPAAERYNLIDAVDRFVIHEALAMLVAHPPGDASVFAVNISARSLGNRLFLPYVLREIEASGLAPSQIAFEITETAAISNLDCAIRFISAVRKIGCQLVLDDFGCGLSSFAYLRDLPVDFLKIDGDFVRRVARSSIDRALVESINQVGHVMGLETIAEGVEDQETLAVLREIGVDYVQGFLLDEPKPLQP